MENSDSPQNGQESKEMDSMGDSPFVNSNGMKLDYYNGSNFKGIPNSNNFTENSQNQKWYTEQREEINNEDVVSTSMKLDQLFDEAAQDEKFKITQTFEYRNSSPEELQQNKNQNVQEYTHFENNKPEYVKTPVK